MTVRQEQAIDVDFKVGSPRESQEEIPNSPSIIDTIVETGKIASRIGEFSQYASPSFGWKEPNMKFARDILIPEPGDTERGVVVSIVAPKANEQIGILIILTGPLPGHYDKPHGAYATVRYSIDRYSNERNAHNLSIRVNKIFYPEAKNFEKPLPPDVETDKIGERHFPITHYRNEDGVDFVEISGPINRLGENVLTFIAAFATESLMSARDFAHLKDIDSAEEAKTIEKKAVA